VTNKQGADTFLLGGPNILTKTSAKFFEGQARHAKNAAWSSERDAFLIEILAYVLPSSRKNPSLYSCSL
jgi:hypothetical protein